MNSPCRFCLKTSHRDDQGSRNYEVIGVRNEGGCKGNLKIQVALTDLTADVDEPTLCLEPIEERCVSSAFFLSAMYKAVWIVVCSLL